jgi:hypothetical protein
MGRRAEQNDRHENSETKKYNKKQTNRHLRRRGKKELEDAPKKKAYRGYSG